MLTDPIFFDTDCLSAFLWVRSEHLLSVLYPNRLYIPYETYNEVSRVPHLKSQVDNMIANQELRIERMSLGSDATKLFTSFITTRAGIRAIGQGEAACIALAITKSGILASNNL